jgi:hypothetical protein
MTEMDLFKYAENHALDCTGSTLVLQFYVRKSEFEECRTGQFCLLDLEIQLFMRMYTSLFPNENKSQQLENFRKNYIGTPRH